MSVRCAPCHTHRVCCTPPQSLLSRCPSPDGGSWRPSGAVCQHSWCVWPAICWVGRANEVGLSFCFEVLTAGLRARRICFRLYPFFLKVVLNSNSVSSLVGWLVGWLEPAFFLDSSPLKMRRVVCPKMSVRNCHYSLRNNPDKSSSQSTHPSTEPSCSPCSTFPRHQSVPLPCRYKVLFTSLPQHCCLVNIAFVYTLPTNYDFIHTQSPIVIQLWFMHDRHLNFFRYCQFKPVHTNITYLTNKGFIIILLRKSCREVTKSWPFRGIFFYHFWPTIRLSSAR